MAINLFIMPVLQARVPRFEGHTLSGMELIKNQQRIIYFPSVFLIRFSALPALNHSICSSL